MHRRRRAGLRNFPGYLLQDELIQCQIRDRTAQPLIPVLEIFIRRA